MTYFIKTTLVDSRTGVPAYEAPTRNGAITPKGVNFIFDIEANRGVNASIYGTTEDEDLLALPHVQELPEESFWQAFKQELIDRAKERKWQVETGGLFINGMFIETEMHDQQRILSAYTGSAVIGEGSVDFSTPNGSIPLSKEGVEELFFTVATHVQECFSWQAEMINEINSLQLSLDNYESVLEPIYNALYSFGSHLQQEDEPIYPEE